jgi:hypothetical protein
MLQHELDPTVVGRGMQLYLPVPVVTDSAFPPLREEAVVRTIRNEAIVITPPDSDLCRIDLEPIDPTILD